jgi:hypothetical protein
VQRIVTGHLGEVSVADGQGKVELYGLGQLLQQNVGSHYTIQCRAVYGDSECGIELLPAVWSADDDVALGDRRRASVYDAREYEVTVAGTTNDTEGEPTWDTTVGNTTTEVETSVWAATTLYTLGKAVRPTVDNGYAYECVTDPSGTTGGTEPTWTTIVGQQVTDGTVTWECRKYVEWTCRDARTKTGTITGVTNNRQFADSSRYEDDNEFNNGKLTWNTGDNSGYTADLKKYTKSGGALEIYEPMPFTVQVGDTYTITQGCNKSFTTCKSRGNYKNFRGYPHLTGITELLRPPQ